MAHYTQHTGSPSKFVTDPLRHFVKPQALAAFAFNSKSCRAQLGKLPVTPPTGGVV